MGEIAISARGGDELVAIGLGSCIGLAVLDRRAGVAGLAHIVLPEATTGNGNGSASEAAVGKFADTAVPELISRLERAGAVKRRLEAVLIGGARMFALGSTGLDIGARNTSAVRAALARARIRVHAEEVGGSRGRTARVHVGAAVTSQLAGGQRTVLWGAL